MTFIDLFIARNRRIRVLQKVAEKAESYLRAFENVNYDLETNGEKYLVRALARHSMSVVFDVGANEGHWASMTKTIAPSAELYCFEILPETAAKLRERLGGMPGIHLNDVGLSDAAGDVPLKTFTGHSTWTTMADFQRPSHSVRSVQARVVVGDEYVENQRIDHIDLLKIDVEGAEDRVLKGLERTFLRQQIAVVQFEYGNVNILTRYLLKDFHAFFARHGFVVGKLYPNYVAFSEYRLADENFRGPNYVAVHKTKASLVDELSR